MNNVAFSTKVKRTLSQNSATAWIWVITVLMIISSGIFEGDFFRIRNILNLTVTALPLLLCSCAQQLIIITGGIDLSVGSVLSFATVTVAALAKAGSGGWVCAVIAALGGGAVFGMINGLIITKGKQQPIIVTIATSEIIAGCALIIQPTAGHLIENMEFCAALSGGSNKWMPILIIIAAVVGSWVLLSKTVWGRSVYAVGGNEISAVSSGINVDAVKIIAYILAGVFSAFAGVVQGTIMYSGDPNSGNMFPMKSITAVVIGGTMLSGGRGSIWGTLAGVIILAIINNILNLMGISTFYQYIVQGVILLVALMISAMRNRQNIN